MHDQGVNSCMPHASLFSFQGMHQGKEACTFCISFAPQSAHRRTSKHIGTGLLLNVSSRAATILEG